MRAMTSPDLSPTPRRLRRSGTDRVVSGVAGGIAEHFELDPSLVRIGFGVLSIIGGIGLVLYAVCAVVLPAEPGAPSLAGKHKAALAVIVIAAVCSFPVFGDDAFFVGPGIVGALVVCALGVLAWRAVGGKPDQRLLRVSLIVASAAFAIVLGIAAGAVTALGGGVAVAAAVIAAGVALIIGGFLGGARWLIVPALLLAMPVAVVAAADIEFKGGVGDREYRPASVNDLRDMYRLGAGRLRVDLRDVELTPTTTTSLKVRVGTGRLRLIAPEGVCVQTTAHAGVGHIDLGAGRDSDGIDVDAERRPTAEGNAPVLVVDARAGLGEILVSSDRSACDAR
jgi:phage shock protein PspC (stress-responsive transcriptional regulator)